MTVHDDIPSSPGFHIGTVDELNARFVEADAVLDDKAKAEHPVVAFAEAKQRYPDQWVAMETISISSVGELLTGRLFAVAADRRALYRRIKALRKRHPGLVLIDHYTGQFKDTGRIVV